MAERLQKALYFDLEAGDFVLRTKDIPRPASHEVLIKILGAALNQDWKIRKRKPSSLNNQPIKYPILLGADVAGIVEELGEDVTKFKKGDRVIVEASWSDNYGAYQQYALAAEDLTAKLPDNVSFLEAASIPLALATVVIGLYGDCDRNEKVKKLQPPPWEAGGDVAYKRKAVVVMGGSSSVGQLAIQVLRLSGFSKIITTASLHNADALKALGATHVIDRNANFVAEANVILEGDVVDLIYDAIGSQAVQAPALEVLAPGGQMIAAAYVHVDKAAYPDKHFVTLYADFRLPSYWQLGSSLASNLPDLLASGAIKPNRIEVLPDGLAGVHAGLARLEKGEISGKKLVMNPQETP